MSARPAVEEQLGAALLEHPVQDPAEGLGRIERGVGDQRVHRHGILTAPEARPAVPELHDPLGQGGQDRGKGALRLGGPAVGHEGAPTHGRLDQARPRELLVGQGDRVAIHAQPPGQLANGGQPAPGRQVPGRHLLSDLLGDLSINGGSVSPRAPIQRDLHRARQDRDRTSTGQSSI